MSYPIDPRQPESLIGKHISALPTPSLVISRPLVEENARAVLENVKERGISLRFHAKTLKCEAATRIALGEGTAFAGQHTSVIASTVPEVRGLVPLVKEGLIKDITFSLPLVPSILPTLTHLSSLIRLPSHFSPVILFVDHPSHIKILESFQFYNPEAPVWPVFVKLDAGNGRAGISTSSPAQIKDFVQNMERSAACRLYGFYTHSGHSYRGKNRQEVERVMGEEVRAVLDVAQACLGHDNDEDEEWPVVLSFGATPQVHIVDALSDILGAAELPKHWEVEIHAGNFVVKDLQQVSTGVCAEDDQAMRLLAEVCSVYPARNEALLNAGLLALTSETSSAFPGFGVVDTVLPFDGFFPFLSRDGTAAKKLPQERGKGMWYVRRISQEHGIVSFASPSSHHDERDAAGAGGGSSEKADETFAVGDKVLLQVSHACITAAGHGHYFVVDERDFVREVWRPWRWW